MSYQKKSNNKPEKTSRSAITRPYRIVSYISLALFIGLIAYIIWFQIEESDRYKNNSYNVRQEEAEEQVLRGSILASDGTTVLADTEVDSDGNEVRNYPYGSLFAHTVGYEVYGGSGLEQAQNSVLTQSHSNIVTQVQNDLEEVKKAGDNLVTTLNPTLQQKAADLLGSMQGAVFVMDVDTGDVLADYSSPSFDANTVEEDWDSLVNNDSGVLLNRAMQGLYPPGSTFKIVTALAYYREYGTFDNFSYNCTGTYEESGFTIHCASYEQHGSEDFADAMANSCNCAFAYMAVNMIDPQILIDTAEDLGFNQEMDILLPYSESTFSLTTDSATALYMQTAIGQGDTEATPMQMCMIVDAIANDGEMMLPNFVSRVESSDGTQVSGSKQQSYGQVLTEDEVSALRTILQGVTQYGTASELASNSYNIIGKTGTAEYGDEGNAHSWFVGYSNTGNNDIVVCVLVEGGGNGVYTAAPLAGELITTYFES
ncbi:MAG: penicillin-binding transpeptidase domain-containing protein [Eubacteriales bacterium]|jgi:peptidoglycan glycosyltransferase